MMSLYVVVVTLLTSLLFGCSQAQKREKLEEQVMLVDKQNVKASTSNKNDQEETSCLVAKGLKMIGKRLKSGYYDVSVFYQPDDVTGKDRVLTKDADVHYIESRCADFPDGSKLPNAFVAEKSKIEKLCPGTLRFRRNSWVNDIKIGPHVYRQAIFDCYQKI